MKPILEALKSLLTFQKSATYSELASVSGKKKMEVLNCLNLNSALITKKKKGEQSIITGFADIKQIQRVMSIKSGESFCQDLSYNRCERDRPYMIWCTNPKADKLRTTEKTEVIYTILPAGIIENTEENIQQLLEMGLIHADNIKLKTLEELWQE